MADVSRNKGRDRNIDVFNDIPSKGSDGAAIFLTICGVVTRINEVGNALHFRTELYIGPRYAVVSDGDSGRTDLSIKQQISKCADTDMRGDHIAAVFARPHVVGSCG
jgi:hypothetical protein